MIDWPEQLKDDLRNRRAILFIGSGVSRNSLGADGITRPQTWASFLHAAATEIGILPVVQEYLDVKDYLTTLDVLRSRLTRDQYAQLVRKEYLDPMYSEADIHRAIYKIDAQIVLTPNFDKIFDVYVSSVSRGTTLIKQYFDLDLARYIRGDRRVVIKVHGSVDSAENMIFGRRDYAESRVRYRWFYDILRALILTNTVVFVGCGTDDPDIRLLLEDAHFNAGFAREHYFISAKGMLSQSMIAILSGTMNLRVLEYDYDLASGDHSDLTTSLESLAAEMPWNS